MDSFEETKYTIGASEKPISNSKRLRNVLFLLWQQKQVEMDFEGYYEEQMNEIIEGYKALLK